jgi:hypothetical protein
MELEDLRTALKQQVIKRDVIEGEKADAARKSVSKAAGKLLRAKKDKTDSEAALPAPTPDPSRDLADVV